MPKVVISFDPEHHEYFVTPYHGQTLNKEYDVIMDMKASHFRNILKNVQRYQNDLNSLRKLFVEAQMSGRELRER